jgi:broad specificity polyphosphatase/5'/3'-nucleotidase SurE
MWNINVPLVPPPAPPIHITHIHKGHYGSLYKPLPPNTPGPLSFKWAPTFHIQKHEPEIGSDGHALQHKHISVSPMVANFECVDKTGLMGILDAVEDEDVKAEVKVDGDANPGEKLEQPGLANKM